MKTTLLILSTVAGLATATAQRGLPQDARQAIHALLAAHVDIKREVTLTEDGYRALTTTENAEIARLLQKHVAQMEARLRKGLMVRRWDPAYAEFVRHYDDIDIEVTNIENGVSVVAQGRTEAAKKVARNHAGIISKLVENGMEEAHKAHEAVLDNTSKDDIASPPEEKLEARPAGEATCPCKPPRHGTTGACCRHGDGEGRRD